MATYTIRPTSVVEKSGALTPSASATIVTNLSDSSDATVVTNSGAKVAKYVFGLQTASVPSDEFIARVGASLRWKGNAAGKYTVGARLYRSTDKKPAGAFTIAPNITAAFTTTETGYASVDWPLTDLAKLRALWVDNRANSAWATVQHAALFGTVYTIKKATAVPQNVTESSSVFATVPVDVTAVIDWEVDALDWQNLRNVTIEVQVRSGGTSPTTGTLVSGTSVTVPFTVSATETVSVAIPDALANGSFNVYARALRYRDDGLARDDQWGAWSSAATLTMSAPLPTAPTLATEVKATASAVKLTVTPVATTSYTNPFIYVERSADDGVTWLPVRFAWNVAGAFGTGFVVYDLEAPRAVGLKYRARVAATLSGVFLNESNWSLIGTATVPANDWTLKQTSDPAKNIVGVSVVGEPSESVEEDMGVFRPLGRKYPVIVNGTLSGWNGEVSVLCNSSAEWAALKTVIESREIVLIESPFGWSKFVRIMTGVQSVMSGTYSTARRAVSLSYLEVDRPTVREGVTFTGVWPV